MVFWCLTVETVAGQTRDSELSVILAPVVWQANVEYSG